jgi:hypothetical protein
MLIACVTRTAIVPPMPPTPPSAKSSAAALPPASVETLAAQIDADARRSDHEANSAARAELAAAAARDAASCLALAPGSPVCLYGQALALGMQARAHPTGAGEYLTHMLATLSQVEAIDPAYDEAGPSRVRSLVLIRAPGWPLGPGDAEAGLLAARRAVTLKPMYPPNLLALAEALSKTGDQAAARDTFERARMAALALPMSLDRQDWLNQAEQGLKGR